MKFSLSPLILLFFVLGSSLLNLRANDEKALFETIESVPILDPNNKADPETGLGAVKDPFCMGKYKVTAKQYVEFLNSVAKKNDPYELFDDRMENDPAVSCIKKSIDKKGLFSYQTIPGREDFPITYVDLFCCLRFCNWLSHGSPCGDEGYEVTETGAYTIETTGDDHEEVTIEASAGSSYFLPTEDQWYKAAYYHHHPQKLISYDPESPIPSVQDSDSFLYWNYPTQTMSEPWNGLGSSSEAANYCKPHQWWYSEYTTSGAPFLTPVGLFKNTPGPYETFDMGGDVSEWTYSLNNIEESTGISQCFVRGGSWASEAGELHRSKHTALEITTRNNTTGFRIASSKNSYEKLENKKDLAEELIDEATAPTHYGLDITRGSYTAAKWIAANVGTEVLEAIALNFFGEYMILPYCLYMGAVIAYEYYNGEYEAAEATFVHAMFDIATMLGGRFGINVAEKLANGLREVRLGSIVDFFEWIHGQVHELIDLMGIEHGHAPAPAPVPVPVPVPVPAQNSTSVPGWGWGHKHNTKCNNTKCNHLSFTN
ncbi:MAG: formylglycine-generating enzyme family protein [Chthoniobacterales bacterium]|nr:formylglycine-generating enzyme family protein [Chthoniobacterales bacterium]